MRYSSARWWNSIFQPDWLTNLSDPRAAVLCISDPSAANENAKYGQRLFYWGGGSLGLLTEVAGGALFLPWLEPCRGATEII